MSQPGAANCASDTLAQSTASAGNFFMPPAPVNAEGGGTTASLSALPVSAATDTTTTVLNMVNARLAEISADAPDTTTVDTVDASGNSRSQPMGGVHWHMFTKSNDPLDVQSHNSPRASKRQIFVTGGKHRQTKSFDDVKLTDNAEAEKPDRHPRPPTSPSFLRVHARDAGASARSEPGELVADVVAPFVGYQRSGGPGDKRGTNRSDGGPRRGATTYEVITGP